MKAVYKMIAAACLSSVFACEKKDVQDNFAKVIKQFPTVELNCDIDEPVVDNGSSGNTKVYGVISDLENYPGRHTVKWKAGDQISMFSIVYTDNASAAKGTILNFSDLYATLRWGDGTKTFTMTVPNLKEIYGESSGVSSYLCAIYPATTLDVSVTSMEGNTINVTSTPNPSTPLILPSVQDGTGWRYSVFIARSSTFSAAYNSPAGGGGITFNLMSTLLRMKLNTTKNISQVVLTTTADVMVGNVGSITMDSYQSAAGVPENFSLATGCNGNTVVVRNGGVLPTDLYIAIKELRENATFTVTFTATDGSSITRSFTNPAGPANRKVKKVLSLGTVTLNDWVLPVSAEPANEAVVNMGMGINVGGLNSVTETDESIESRCAPGSWDPVLGKGTHLLDRTDPVTYETNGNYDAITQTTMNKLKEAGFNSIRLPVTWFNHIGSPVSAPGQIDEVWLEHVAEVIDMVRDAGMYAIINMHHDAGTLEYSWLKADWANYDGISATFKDLWGQIAAYFKDYDKYLLFEGYNEITDENKRWHQPTTSDGFLAANKLNQDFVDVVRASGGNNTTRNLIVSTYTASESNPAFLGFVMPDDIVDNHLMVQVHSYRPNQFVTARPVGDDSRLEFYESEKNEIDEMFDRIQTNILDKGWSCVLGEYGAFYKLDKSSGKRNELGRAEHAYYYTTRALQRGIAPMYWYNPMSYRERDTGDWTYPVTAQGLIDAWDDYCNGKVVYKKYDHDVAYPL